ncbi:MAG: RNA 2',3'-cyclic phosphodiesterase [Synergistales bacterium]|nr:RNA 2',3'-cyclic phosphodiesterase [Synergistales bacterium]
MNEGNIRSFVSLALPNEVKNAVRDRLISLKPLFPGLKWVNENNLHLTVKFCGEQPAVLIRTFEDSISSVFMEKKPERMRLTLGELGAFPSLQCIRTLFIRVNGEVEKLGLLASIIEKKARESGIPAEERRFHPHITLARARNPEKIPLSSIGRFLEAEWTADAVYLMKSVLKPHGPEYSLIRKWIPQ